MDREPPPPFRHFTPSAAASAAPEAEFRWEGVDPRPYKEEGSAPFQGVTRHALFADPALAADLRYFEVAAGGHSTLERHGHVHAVVILRGRGHALIEGAVRRLQPFDLVAIPSWSWHQFRAARTEPLGFLCLVNADRDRPQLPSEADLTALRADPAIARFLDGAIVD